MLAPSGGFSCRSAAHVLFCARRVCQRSLAGDVPGDATSQ